MVEEKTAFPEQWESDCIRWRGKVLTGKYIHWCHEWDGLPVDETTEEFMCCYCFGQPLEVVAIQAELRRAFDDRMIAHEMGRAAERSQCIAELEKQVAKQKAQLDQFVWLEGTEEGQLYGEQVNELVAAVSMLVSAMESLGNEPDRLYINNNGYWHMKFKAALLPFTKTHKHNPKPDMGGNVEERQQ